MELETRRLVLREMGEGDVEAFRLVWGDDANMQYYPYRFDDERILQWIHRNQERYAMFGFGLWAVVLKETGEVIGDCGLTMQMIGDTICPEIGYHMRRDMQRKGYTTEAAKAVRDWTFRNTPFQRVYSYMKYTNVPSAKTAEAYGCRFMEEFEDEVNERTRVYLLTKEEWERIH